MPRRRWSASGDGRPARARRRAATASMTCSVAPTRRYHGNLVVMPTWANWVEASIGGAAAPDLLRIGPEVDALDRA